MKFKEALKGTRSELEVELPRYMRDGQPIIALARPLMQNEEEEILAAALKDAEGNGLKSPKKGDDLYDAAVMVHTVARGYVDPDSPADKREHTFKDAAEVREWYGADEIGYLYERHEAHQNECSPSLLKATPDQLMRITEAIASAPNADPFIKLSPGLRCIWARFTAVQLVTSREHSSPSGSSSAATT